MKLLINFHDHNVIRVMSQLAATVTSPLTKQWQKLCLLLNFNLNAIKIIFIFKNLIYFDVNCVKSALVCRAVQLNELWRKRCIATKWWIKKGRWKLISNHIYKS